MIFDESKLGHETNSGGLTWYKPNLKVRLTENIAELMQDELLVYLQTYTNMDYKMPSDGEYKINLFPIYTKFSYNNLLMDPLLIDPFTFHFNLTKIENDGPEYIFLQIPLIESWVANFDFSYFFFWIPIHDNLRLELTNVTCSM